MTLTYDLDLQFSTSRGHDLLRCQSSRLKVSRIKSKWKQIDGWRDSDVWTDKRTGAIVLPLMLTQSVIKQMLKCVLSDVSFVKILFVSFAVWKTTAWNQRTCLII